ncbi:hypothetical protein BU15DRAFT_82894 [Melanogaster broomeanus]|nr:hypothetical protein BU15DRAFT_82894 [Melanogaster broomeanus]
MDRTPITATLPRPLRVPHCPGVQQSGGGPTAGNLLDVEHLDEEPIHYSNPYSDASWSAPEIAHGSGSEGYDTARSPSFKSLPSIPLESDYATAEKCRTEASTESYTVERCASDMSTEYVTAEMCRTETETDFYTVERCKSEAETEFVTAELCECEGSETSETHYEAASLCRTIPSEASTPRSPAIDVLLDTTPESVPLPPSELSPTMSSVSRDLGSERLEETEIIQLLIAGLGDVSISLPSTLESTSEAESSRIVSGITESSDFPMRDIPVSSSSMLSLSPLPTPLKQSIQLQEGRDASFDTSFMRPMPSTPLPPLPVPHSVSSPSSGPTPMTLTSTASSSLSRTPSSVSSMSSLSTGISLVLDDAVSLADAPAPSEISTVPSLLSSRLSSGSMHYYVHPTMGPLPVFPAPLISVSMSTPHSNQPSTHSDPEMEPTRMHTEHTEIITHEATDCFTTSMKWTISRGLETHEISEDARNIRDELVDLSEYMCTRLVATERAPPRRDQSVGGTSVISEHRVAPVGP